MFKFKRTSRLRPFVDFTPLIDCAFTLIIFFAVTTTMITAYTGMKINLPKKSQVEDLPKYVQISVKRGDAGYSVFFKDMQVQEETLGDMIKNELVKNPEASFVVAAEPEVVYDNVIKVVDIANEAGATKIALQLNRKGNEKEAER